MQVFWPEHFLQSRHTAWAIASVTLFLFLFGNLPWQLDDYDQAKQAFTSFEMIKEGRWFYQQTPHEHVATKPPLIGWISAGLFAITRSWDMAWRTPSLLATIALAVLLFRTSTAAYGRIAGTIALSAFGFNLLTPRLATLVRTDMPLAFVIFLIGLLIWEKIREGAEWKPRDRIYMFALLTVAMLIKGPIVYAFLIPGILLFQWRHARDDGLRQLPKTFAAARPRYHSTWCGWWPWVASLGMFLLWVIAGIRAQPGFFDQVVMREFIGRFGETIHRPQPLYFYIPHLVHKFAPWSLLIIGLAIDDLRSRQWRPRTIAREISPETFWLLCWSVGGLIVMSLIPSKRVDRVFPVIPPLCLLLAAQVYGRGTLPRKFSGVRAAPRPYLWVVMALAVSIFFSGGYTMVKVAAGYRDHRDALAVFGRKVRATAEAHHWRYEVIYAKDESLLLYLRKTNFITTDRAIAEWNRGNLDALVAPIENAADLLAELRASNISGLKSSVQEHEPRNEYAFITR